MIVTKQQWTHSTTRFISPFKTTAGALDGCMMRVAKHGEFSAAESYDADEQGFDANFSPELKFSIDPTAISESCGLKADQLVLAVLVRDRNLGRFEKVNEWPLESSPEFHEIEPNSLAHFSSPNRMDVCVVLSPAFDLKTEEAGLASRRGHLIAEKTFKIWRPTQALDFPRVWRSSEDFKNAGLSEQSLWALRWKSYSVELPMPEVLEVWFNEGLQQKFALVAVDNPFANLFKKQLAASILAEIAYCVFCMAADSGSASVSGENDSILSILGTRFEDVSELNFGKLTERAQDSDGFQFFSSWSQQIVDLADSVQNLGR